VPILHIQLTKQTTTEGKSVPLSPALALRQRGPVVQVSVTIEQNAGRAFSDHVWPQPRTGLALIDTGASNTCIDEALARELGLPVVDVGRLSSATHAEQQCNVYPVEIALPTVVLSSPRTLGASLAPQGLIALIGRDVLQSCLFFYNGPVGQITLSL
jgi:predicted aspartyl protease